jgi:hypothetical protein
MRTRLIALAIFSIWLFVIADAALLDFLANRGVPSAERCAAEWNRSPNVQNRAAAANEHLELAVVSGWLAKDRFPGCGVLFRRRDGQAWLPFSSQLRAGRVDDWDVVSGDHWGFDSPEGGPETPNAMVTADGRVRLIEV